MPLYIIRSVGIKVEKFDFEHSFTVQVVIDKTVVVGEAAFLLTQQRNRGAMALSDEEGAAKVQVEHFVPLNRFLDQILGPVALEESLVMSYFQKHPLTCRIPQVSLARPPWLTRTLRSLDVLTADTKQAWRHDVFSSSGYRIRNRLGFA